MSIDTPWGEAVLLNQVPLGHWRQLRTRPRSGEPLEQSNDQKKTSPGVFFCLKSNKYGGSGLLGLFRFFEFQADGRVERGNLPRLVDA